jgi:hypothetical protein
LSKKYKDVKEQGKVIKEYKTQVLLPCIKIDPAIVQDLQLAPIKLTPELEQELELAPTQELESTTDFTS